MKNNPHTTDPTPEDIIHEVGKDFLSVSWDYWDNPDDKEQWKAVLLWVHRYAKDGDHEHIELDQDAARKLHNWLGRFLQAVDKKG